MAVESLEADGFPTSWEPGEHPLQMKGLGLVPLGIQVVRLSELTRRDSAHEGVRILRDTGRGISGGLTAVSTWDHSMAIAPDPDHPGKTLYRDQLIFGAGAATLAFWPGFWVFWQWRMHQIARLAPTWRFDLGVDSDGTDEAAPDAPPAGAAATPPLGG